MWLGAYLQQGDQTGGKPCPTARTLRQVTGRSRRRGGAQRTSGSCHPGRHYSHRSHPERRSCPDYWHQPASCPWYRLGLLAACRIQRKRLQTWRERDSSHSRESITEVISAGDGSPSAAVVDPVHSAALLDSSDSIAQPRPRRRRTQVAPLSAVRGPERLGWARKSLREARTARHAMPQHWTASAGARSASSATAQAENGVPTLAPFWAFVCVMTVLSQVVSGALAPLP